MEMRGGSSGADRDMAATCRLSALREERVELTN
jgi:hypothetical protein